MLAFIVTSSYIDFDIYINLLTINVIAAKEPYRSIADNSASKRGLGWEPTVDLREWIDAYKERIGLE